MFWLPNQIDSRIEVRNELTTPRLLHVDTMHTLFFTCRGNETTETVYYGTREDEISGLLLSLGSTHPSFIHSVVLSAQCLSPATAIKI